MHHLVNIVRLHFCAVVRDYGTEIKEVAEDDFVFTVGFPGFRGNFGRLRNHFENAVGRKIKYVTVGFHPSRNRAGALHAEYCLHIRRGRSVLASGEVKHCRPFPYGNSCGEFAAREGYSVGVFGVIADGAVNLREWVAGGFLVFVSAYVHGCVTAKKFVFAQHFRQCVARRHTRQNPKCMSEKISVFIATERIECISIVG